jgi:hypothetical protein
LLRWPGAKPPSGGFCFIERSVAWFVEARYCRGVGRRWDDFLSTPEGKVAQYRRRKQQRVSIILDEIEPQSKKMRDPEKDNFQRRVIEALDDVRRGAFRGPLALSVDLNTTKPTAPQAHTIAKNLLDLLGTRRPEVKSSRKELLYKDDSQVHALAVSCRHGQDRPSIWISARSFGNVLKDLEVAADALPELEEDLEHCYQNDQEDDSIDYFKTLIAEEAFYRRRLGDSRYQACPAGLALRLVEERVHSIGRAGVG